MAPPFLMGAARSLPVLLPKYLQGVFYAPWVIINFRLIVSLPECWGLPYRRYLQLLDLTLSSSLSVSQFLVFLYLAAYLPECASGFVKLSG